MRKNLLFGLFATMVLLLTTACQKENDLLGNGEATISFEISTPQMATRAFSDGTTAKKLQYAVYDENGAFIGRLSPNADEFKPVEITDFNGKRTINIQLAAGKTYYVLFWASALNSPYSVDYKTKTLSVDYANTVCNSDANDAFYCYKKVTVDATKSEPVTLKRPFAQLNIGTNDLSVKNEVDVTKTGVKVKGIYNTFNLAENVLGGDINTEYTFALAARPEGETFKVDGYEYLAMAYVLVGNDKNYVTDVKLCYGASAETAKTREFTNIPVRGNYRTNIYGALLTNNIGFDVEIDKDFDEPDENLYYVSVDGVHYTNFGEAVAKALELNKPIDFITDVKIDADNTITVPAGKELTLNLNGCTLSGVSDQTGANRNMFDVRGTMTVNGANTMTRAAAEGNGIISIKHLGENMKWDSSTNVFNVTAGGVLNIMNVNAINYGGSDMGFVAHLNNWGEVTLNVENSTLESNYVAVRVFNSGNDMNNVAIHNSTLKGGNYAFWVHNYTVADFGTQEKADAHKALLNFDIFNGTNEFIGKNDTPIRYGFTNSVYANADGLVNITDAEGNVVEGIGIDADGYYAVTSANGLAWVAENVAEYEGFAGKTIILLNDIDLTGVKTKGDSFSPIGLCCSKQDVSSPFTGHFDGNGKTIKGIYQSGWDFGYEWGITGYLGFFGYVKDATIENLTIEGMESVVEGGTLAAIAGRADGECTFKNITVKNSKLGTYNNRCGGIVGWTGGYTAEDGTDKCYFTFENINICNDVVLGGLWGSFDSSIGGVMGQLNSGGSASFKNVIVSCRIDAYNDCTASYDYYNYRMCGMLIGQMTKTTEIDGSTYPDVAAYGIEFDNVTVNYGTWMYYHYCEPTPGLNGGRGMRVEAGFTYDGLPEDFDHTQCVDNHYNCIPFDQLFGGVQTACKGVKAWDGVTVNYPAAYTCSLCGQQHGK